MNIRTSLVGALALTLCWLSTHPLWATTMPTNGMQVWLKADAIVNVSDGGAVSNWPDSSGLGWNATNGSVANQPTLVMNAVNGKPTVRFDGVNDYLARDNYVHGTDNGMMFVVTKRVGSPTGYHNILIQGVDFNNNVPTTIYWQIYADSSSKLTGNLNATALDCDFAANYSNTVYQILELRKDNSGAGSVSCYYNGTFRTSKTGTQALGNRYYVGGWLGSKFTSGDIAEVLIYNAALGANDRQLAEGLLAWKYDLTNSLPIGHPWKNSDPNVAAAPAIENRMATNISLTGASLNGYLMLTGSAPAMVSMAYGLTNGGPVNSGLWQATNTWALGAWKEGETVTYPATGLESNRIYFYRYAATNSAGYFDSEVTVNFMTAPIEVSAPDATAEEGGDTLMFTLSRPATATNISLTVPFAWSGSAQPTRDFFYTDVASNVVFAIGQTTTNLVLNPVDDPFAEPQETVILTPGINNYMNLGISVTGTIAASSTHAPTNTIGYWRFETASGVMADSSGNSYNLSTITTSVAALYQSPLAPSGLSSAYPKTIPDSGRLNSSALTGRGMVPYDPAFTTKVFTVEAFVSINAPATGYRAIVARWNSINFCWLIGLTQDLYPKRLFFRYYGSPSRDVYAPTADFDIEPSKDYYIAVAVDGTKVGAGKNGVLFRIKNLTDGGPLVSGYADMTGGSIPTSANTPLEIRQYNGLAANAYDGWLDELRFSSGVLSDAQLMITPRQTAAGTLILVR